MTVSYPRVGFMVPALLVMAGVFGDIFTTQAALSSGVTEKNPVAAALMSSFGLTEFLVIKLLASVGLIAVLVVAAWRRKDTKMYKYTCFGLWFLFAVYLFVALSNLQALL